MVQSSFSAGVLLKVGVTGVCMVVLWDCDGCSWQSRPPLAAGAPRHRSWPRARGAGPCGVTAPGAVSGGRASRRDGPSGAGERWHRVEPEMGVLGTAEP